MQISFSPEMLAITIQDDANTFYHLQNIIEKNFSKRIGRKNKTIVFKQDHEEVQRRYFLKLINKIYKRKNNLADNHTSKNIEKALDKTIKISHLKSNQLQQQLKINITIEDNYAVIFDIGTKNSVLVSYLKNYFKNHLIKYRLKNNTVTLYPLSKHTATLLDKLIHKKEIVGRYIEFCYDKNELVNYKNSLDNKTTRKNKFNTIFSLLDEFYKVLQCNIDDNFETIRKRYLKLVKQYHPDKISYTNPSLTAHYIDKFKTIQHAYEMLKIHFDHEKSA